MKYIKFLLITLAIACTAPKENSEAGSSEEKVLNVYSHRHYDADKQAFERFTKETGIEINLVKAGADELINRLEMEGQNSPADVLITVDAAKLNRAKSKGLLQPVDANTKNKPEFVDVENHWYAITYRARVVAFDKEDVDISELSTYEDLASNKWKNRILIRSSSSSYNQSLLSSIIHENGPSAAQEWANGIVANMAREPKGGDRDQIKAIASGVGDIAVVNTYYVGLLLNSENPEEVKVGERVGIYFPNQEDRGGHINISGIGVTKYAPNKANAIKFIEFLTSKEIQEFYAATSFEYPVHKEVSPDSTIAAWGEFKIDNLDYAQKPELLEEAIKIFDEAGWN
ncbi:extracellular solute-binding protein [Ekhidna sp.]|uniref:extracellular solute-binding protein n=1 Tax=Ekhidna sp. TaxID=2608089 RepID=UPI003296B7EB